MSGEKRPDGWYWVRGHGLDYFVPVLCIAGMWGEYEDDRCPDYEYAEIGPPCNRDDSEQLRLAREVLEQLVAVVGLTAFKHESQRAVLQEAVDAAMSFLRKTKESGVRL